MQFGPIDGLPRSAARSIRYLDWIGPAECMSPRPEMKAGRRITLEATSIIRADTVVQLTRHSTQSSVMSIWYTGAKPAQITVTFDDGTRSGRSDLATAFWISPGSRSVTICRVRSFIPGSPPAEIGRFIFGSPVTPSTDQFGFVARRRASADLIFMATSRGRIEFRLSFEDHLVAGRLTDYSATRPLSSPALMSLGPVTLTLTASPAT